MKAKLYEAELRKRMAEQEKLEEAKKKNENAKAGSLADKANLVKRFNEGQK